MKHQPCFEKEQPHRRERLLAPELQSLAEPVARHFSPAHRASRPALTLDLEIDLFPLRTRPHKRRGPVVPRRGGIVADVEIRAAVARGEDELAGSRQVVRRRQAERQRNAQSDHSRAGRLLAAAAVPKRPEWPGDGGRQEQKKVPPKEGQKTKGEAWGNPASPPRRVERAEREIAATSTEQNDQALFEQEGEVKAERPIEREHARGETTLAPPEQAAPETEGDFDGEDGQRHLHQPRGEQRIAGEAKHDGEEIC